MRESAMWNRFMVRLEMGRGMGLRVCGTVLSRCDLLNNVYARCPRFGFYSRLGDLFDGMVFPAGSRCVGPGV